MSTREMTVAGRNFPVRPLTRGEIRALRAQGFHLGRLDLNTVDEAVDLVLGLVLGERAGELDDLPNPAALRLFKAVLDRTFGDEESEKNS